MTGNVHRLRELVSCRVEITTIKRALVGISNSVHDEVELAPLFLKRLKDSIH